MGLAVAEILGVEVETGGKLVKAFLRCNGGGTAALRYRYFGEQNCAMAADLAPGPVLCKYGCLGFGNCIRSCPFDAMAMGKNGLPVILPERCTACGICANACPKKLIILAPVEWTVFNACISRDKDEATQEACSSGCTACVHCVSACEAKAITIIDNLAVIDYEKCTSCGKCTEVCPTGCMSMIS